MKLYGYWRSPATYRVRLALAWKGIAFEAVPLDLRRGEHRRLTYLNRNPQGLVPLLEEADGTRVAQSVAILDYLEETRPLPPLLPAWPAERARVRALVQFLACDVQPLTSRRVGNHLRRRLGQGDDEVAEWNRHWLAQGLAAAEAEAMRTAGRFAFGDVVTMADLCLVPQLYAARRYGIDLEPYPTLLRIEEACLEVPALERARPDRQPEARAQRGAGAAEPARAAAGR